MERLSRDVFDIILDYIEGSGDNDRLTSFASVARSWQVVIEARTLRSIFLRHHDQLDTFSEVFSTKTSHRRGGLRHLYLSTCLPTMSDTPEEHEKSNICFQNVIIKFFNVLESLGRDVNGSGRVGPISVTLRWKSGGPMAEEPNWMDWPPENSFLTLPKGFLASVASTNIVSKLKTFASPGITPHPSALCQIASKMTSLQRLTMELFEPTLRDCDMRIEHRWALAAGVYDFRNSLPNLQSLTLTHQKDEYFTNHSFECPDMTDEHGVDQLCRALRKLGEDGKLVELELDRLRLSSDLFCERASPLAECKEQSAPRAWPSLRKLDLFTGLVAANGQWLATGDYTAVSHDAVPESRSSSSEYSEDSQQGSLYDRRASPPRPEHRVNNQWRTRLDTTSFNPFVEDLMRAVTQRMPSIEHFGLGITWTPPGAGAASLSGHKVHNVKEFQSSIFTTWELPETVIAMAKEWAGPSGEVKWRRYTGPSRNRYTGDLKWNYVTGNQDV